MEEDIFLINFDENKPYVSVTMPLEIEKATACKRSTYRAVLSAGIIEEKQNKENKTELSFHKNINIENIQEEIRLFYINFINMLDTIKETDLSFPLYTASPWKAKIKQTKISDISIEERYYHSFKDKILSIIGPKKSQKQQESKIIPFRKNV